MKAPRFKHARDPRGAYMVDWSILRSADDHTPSEIIFVPFDAGDARVMSVPAHQTMIMASGKQSSGLTHGVFALRVGDTSVHVAMTPDQMRELVECLGRLVQTIERKAA